MSRTFRPSLEDKVYRMPEATTSGLVHIPLLDITVTPMSADEVVTWVASRSEKTLLLNHNLHSAYLHHTDADFRELYTRADKIVIDGMPILTLASLASRTTQRTHRIGSTDWIDGLEHCRRGGRIVLFGADAASNSAAVSKLRDRLPQWEVFGRDGYCSWREAAAWIKQTRPSLVLVGLGMPRQERFLLEMWDDLPDATYATVGGAIDYVAGANSLAPRWLGRIGLEWAWRLVHDPRRLAHRYLVEPAVLAGHVVRRRTSARRGPTSRELRMGTSTGTSTRDVSENPR
jgi:N-acetylglucosaminyldiphosphoundecaprenol N-acetyl-beta-D-mannosaminyltransferase